MAKGEKSGADSTKNTKKARKREAATGAFPPIEGEKKHFQRIKKGRRFEPKFLLPGYGEHNRRDESTAKVGIKNLLP
jgi:hypothetical protein